MSARTITIEANGKTYAGQIATIRSTRLGYEDHGILTASIICEWKGGGVAVGGFVLDAPSESGVRQGTAYGLDHLIWIMRTVGVSNWEDLAGQQVIVLFEGSSTWGSSTCGLASTVDESEVLDLREHSKRWREAPSSESEDAV